MGDKSAPPPPDYTPIAMAAQSQQASSADQLQFAREALSTQQAESDKVFNATSSQADKNFQLQQDALNWAKGAYADQSDTNKAVIGYDMQQQNRQGAIQDASAANAAQAQKRYETVYQPLEDQAVHDASTYASPDHKDQLMGAAAASSAQATESSRLSAMQNLESFGIDPSSTRYAAMDAGIRVQGAAAQAAASTSAGLQADATQRALMANAINVGRGLPSDVNAGNNTAINAGNAGVGAGSAAGGLGLNALSTGSNIMGSPLGYGSLGNQGYGVGAGAIGIPTGALNAGTGAINAGTQAVGTWGSTVNQGYQNQLGAFNANQSASSGFGSMLGAAAGFAPMLGLSEGGAIPDNGGSAVPVHASPTGGQAIDDVPARLSPGEFVVPKDVVQWKGEEFFQKLALQSRKARQTNSPSQPSAIMAPVNQQPTYASHGAIPAR